MTDRLDDKIRAFVSELVDDPPPAPEIDFEWLGRPARPPLHEGPTQRRPWLPAVAVVGAALLVMVAVGLPILFFGGRDSTVIDQPTTTVVPVVTTLPPSPVFTLDSWQRVGADVMQPVVGLFDMTQVGSRLIAVGFDPGEEDLRQNGVIFASDDGVTWTRLAEDDPALTMGAVLMYGITEGGPGLVAVGMGCEDDIERCSPYATAWTSTDGTSWIRTPYDPAIFGDTATQTSAMVDVITTAGGIVAVGGFEYWTIDEVGVEDGVTIHPAVWTSSDGVLWERSWQGEGAAVELDAYADVRLSMEAVTQSADGRLVAVGSALGDNGRSVAAVWTSMDGRAWERIEPESPAFADETGLSVTMLDIAWGSSGFTAVGTEGGTQVAIWQSPDSRSWTRVDTANQPFDSTGSLGAVSALDAGFVATGPQGFIDRVLGTVTLWTSPDGATWDRVHSIAVGQVQAIVVGDGGIALAGGIFGADDFHAAVWTGPLFDPYTPPPDPGPPDQASQPQSDIDPATVDAADVGPGDHGVSFPGDDYLALDTSTSRLPLGEITGLPDSPRLDFLASRCDEVSCSRDPVVVDPNDNQFSSYAWIGGAPFHIRHGFINEATESLSNDFDVVVYVTRQRGPELAAGTFELGQTYRFASDYVVRGTTTKCGPGYWEQTEPTTCEWFVYDFADGLPPGRYDFWIGWYAPCSKWQDLGLVDSCDNPNEVTSQFASMVNSPWIGDDYTEGWPPPFDPETWLAESSEPRTWGWSAD